MKVLQVNSGNSGGGAERVALSLHEGFRRRGHQAWLAVGERRRTDDPGILKIPVAGRGREVRGFGRLAQAVSPWVGRVRGVGRVQRVLRLAQSPGLVRDWWRGRERFDYPGTASILDLVPGAPDVIHCHNLHGSYFDLRRLVDLSRSAPLALTLHDEWTYTGHCAYTMGLETWRSGCNSCPDLGVYPAIRRDATHENWVAKASIYAQSRLYVCAPSKWLMDRARTSILAEGTAGWRVIPNGVDLSIFRPGDQIEARRKVDLPKGAFILLFAANRVRHNIFKDPHTILEATRMIASAVPTRPVVAIALGEGGPVERFENGELRFVPYEPDPAKVAAYYQAADLYLHAARADNFPTSILEALATGTPVIATAVGGIPEEVRSLAGAPGTWDGPTVATERSTGVLVPPADPGAMSSAGVSLLTQEALRHVLSENAVADARARFDLDKQVDATLAWYREISDDWVASEQARSKR